MNLDSELTVRGFVVHAVDVPMNRPLKTGGGEVGSAAMVLIDLLTEEGIIGCSYLFCATPLVLKPLAKLLSNLAPLIEGEDLAPWRWPASTWLPGTHWQSHARCRW
jgi:mandelate racemase